MAFVSAKYEELVTKIMEEEFFKEFKKTSFLKSKEKRRKEEAIYNEDLSVDISKTMEMMLKNEFDNKSIIRDIWGY